MVRSPQPLRTDTIEIPLGIQESWQKCINLIARLENIPAALVMRVHTDDIEVFLASQNDGNPYTQSERAPLNTGLYCEAVMKKRDCLVVLNALDDPDWDHNPDTKLNMISYMGWPIVWPNGDVFGTICVLDNKEHHYSEISSELLYEFKELIEFSLRSIYENLLLHSSYETTRQLYDERRHLKKLATTDSLCRICNRRALFENGKRLYERALREGGSLAIFMVDIDHFKHINDRYGHLTGDAALIYLSDLLTSVCRPGDVLARYGGDEFALLITDADSEAAAALADRILEATRTTPLRINGSTVPLSVSIGYCCGPVDSFDLNTGIECADQAMLAAKKAGRNRAQACAPLAEAAAEAEAAVEAEA
jgi:diguanylate cyclase (GGDEF)-like protein